MALIFWKIAALFLLWLRRQLWRLTKFAGWYVFLATPRMRYVIAEATYQGAAAFVVAFARGGLLCGRRAERAHRMLSWARRQLDGWRARVFPAGAPVLSIGGGRNRHRRSAAA
jgi:hypothetical protein